mmetsp:Transcript_89185/g.251073  ORF Transcript_89185/g.251073 Transcript_89185/m.251073 type:complete len:241 (+) Transcript_89185:436-1158(+)
MPSDTLSRVTARVHAKSIGTMQMRAHASANAIPERAPTKRESILPMVSPTLNARKSNGTHKSPKMRPAGGSGTPLVLWTDRICESTAGKIESVTKKVNHTVAASRQMLMRMEEEFSRDRMDFESEPSDPRSALEFIFDGVLAVVTLSGLNTGDSKISRLNVGKELLRVTSESPDEDGEPKRHSASKSNLDVSIAVASGVELARLRGVQARPKVVGPLGDKKPASWGMARPPIKLGSCRNA